MNIIKYLFFTILFFNNISYASNIRISGSSTVYPFMSFIAEEYATKHKVKAPLVESIGTGGGFKIFCANNHRNSADIANASRNTIP